MNIVIVAYNAGNTRSVQSALERLGVSPVLSGDAEVIRTADKVVFPGVGAAGAAMQHLQAQGLDRVLRGLKQPVLGICLGMQLLCRHSEEGDTPCLGIIDVPVLRFRGDGKVPQVGWNEITGMNTDLFRNVASGSYMYFVHSYYVPCSPFTTAVTDYIQPYSAAIQQDNFYGVQFHPEKSGTEGQTILTNFLNL